MREEKEAEKRKGRKAVGRRRRDDRMQKGRFRRKKNEEIKEKNKTKQKRRVNKEEESYGKEDRVESSSREDEEARKNVREETKRGEDKSRREIGGGQQSPAPSSGNGEQGSPRTKSWVNMGHRWPATEPLCPERRSDGNKALQRNTAKAIISGSQQ